MRQIGEGGAQLCAAHVKYAHICLRMTYISPAGVTDRYSPDTQSADAPVRAGRLGPANSARAVRPAGPPSLDVRPSPAS
ncbi:hypothetical protein Ahu01nite_056260 [Winogradskya humida]|uniref:Uncharacterized protein n=1 Tax=Winogradskya humida TaxID=113566 RepID=A0ABQ3ZVG5_9ACTN|nr:hypothetical protein Ahu01nite_056260 [Actinoplanes humidus]